MIPRIAVSNVPRLKVNQEGLKFTNAFAGATTLAAIFVVSVARETPKMDSEIGTIPPICPRTSMAFEITRPKITSVEEVTARPKNVNAPMKTGRPTCPTI
jgi:hypothetical protein